MTINKKHFNHQEPAETSNYPSRPFSDADKVELFRHYMETGEENAEKMEHQVAEAYRKIEDTVVGSYKAIENSVVGAYEKVEDHFVDKFLRASDETVEDAKERLKG